MLLKGVRWWSGDRESAGDVRIRRGSVAELGQGLAPARGERVLTLGAHLVLPGLINCHDHLELDLLPHLGSPPYRSFYDWAAEVYNPDVSPIRDVLQVRLRDRLRWGGVRNLIAGVTTVMHHDPYYRRWFTARFPVRVVARYAWSHSLGFGRDLAADFRRSRGPYVVHAAEGVDARAAGELDRLDELGLVGRRTIVVHGIGLTAAQRHAVVRAGCGLVWCPSSNMRLYGRTAKVAALKGKLRIGLGTDSTISGAPHLLDELRSGRDTGLASPDELLRMVTTDAAELLRLDHARGRLVLGGAADLLVVPDVGGTPAETLLQTSPADVALVTVAGTPRLAGRDLTGRLDLGEPNAMVDGAAKWLAVDLAALRGRIRDATEAVDVSANPLWATLQPSGSA